MFGKGDPVYDAWIALEPGAEVMVRRRNGLRQVAHVRQMAPHFDELPPESLSFEVVFWVVRGGEDKRAYKWCSASDIIL